MQRNKRINREMYKCNLAKNKQKKNTIKPKGTTSLSCFVFSLFKVGLLSLQQRMPAGVAGSCLMTVSRTSFRKVGLEAGGGDGENGMGRE